MTSKAVSAYEDKKQDIVVKEFGGVNLSAHRTGIAAEEFSWLENLFPMGFSNMPVIPGPGTSVTNSFAVPNAALMFYANITPALQIGVSAAIDFLFVVKTDGSLSRINLTTGAVVNNILTAGTLDPSTVAIAQWKNERIIIVDKSNYRSYNGASLAQNGSVIQILITSGGAGYTSIPAVTFTGGGGIGATVVEIDMQLGAAPVVAAGGTGYTVGDILTLSGGTTAFSQTAQVRVETLGAGNSVATTSVYRAGLYGILTASPAATSGGTGTGATVTPLWSVASVEIGNPGTTPYLTAPTVVFTGGGFSATATATSVLLLGPTVSPTVTAVPGQAVATFSGRVWVGNGRLVSYSAPDTWFDFTAANAGGSFTMDDETLEANINQLISANNFLYIVGNTSINTVSDVRVGTGPVTLFSNVNISPQIGSQFGQKNPLIPFGKALLFSARFGIYSVSGATPKKISAKLDLLMKAVTLSGGQFLGAGACKLYGALCPAFLVSYPDGSVAGTRTLIIMLYEGKWFFVTQGTPTLLTGATVAGDQRIYASDGTKIYQVFGDDLNDTIISWKAITALWPAKTPISDKQLFKCGMEISPLENSVVTVPGSSTDVPLTITVSLDNERELSGNLVTLLSNTGQWVNAAALVGQWINTGGAVGDWLLPGFNILQTDAETKGRYIGYTLTGSTLGFTINGILGQYEERGKWNASGVS